jgi:UDP-N-acetylglucosamine--N-acetylmuramyl-(pentapeptide) pyrophosphoryl-undecaprenol N-acetylglucosamine transferase
VPLGIAADDHQTANADSMALVAAADVIPEPQFDAAGLAQLLVTRLNDPHGLSVRAAAAKATGRPDAAQALADLAEQIGR